MTAVDRRASARRPARSRPELILGLLSGLVLVLLIVGLPAVLLLVSPLSLDPAPTWHGLVSALTRADDGSLLQLFLALVAWGAWATFTASVVLEVVSIRRRRPTPRVPLLQLQQRSAAGLVAAVVVLLGAPAAPVAASPSSAPAPGPLSVPVVATATATPSSEAAPAPRRAAKHESAPTVVVRRHDTLWRLAERHLGSGLRYREIVRLNHGRTQPDGRALTDPHWIYPGWVLRLPADAHGAGVVRPAAAAMDRTGTLEAVDRGPAAVGPAPEAAAVPAPERGSRTAARTTDEGPSGSGGDHSPGLHAAEASEPVDIVDAAPVIALGLGALTVAGVLAEVSRQRRGAQRSRRTGSRLSPPRPGVAQAERALRAVDSGPVSARVRVGLALLADGCARAGRPLPRISLLRVRAERLELVLGADDQAVVEPYVSTGPASWLWDGPCAAPAPDPERADPCPALVSVGMDGPDLVLANLEAAGAVHVVGEPAEADPVLAALSLDLAARAATGAVSVTVAEEGDGGRSRLAARAGARVLPAGAADLSLASHSAEVRELLDAEGAADVVDARSDGVASEAWAPHVVVGSELRAIPQPWSGAAAVVRGPGPGWTLRPGAGDGERWTLEPAGVQVVPSRLNPTDREHVTELLARATAAREEQVPPVELVRQAREALDGLAVPDPGDDHAPCVHVLGPVHVSGVDHELIPGRVRRATELVVYLALHPGASRHEIDEVMWPGRRVARATRNPFVSRARLWLGRDSAGNAYLPLVADEGEYRLRPEIGCDWYDFARLAGQALATDAPDLGLLVQALSLVRGRPFQGIDPASYGWADSDIQEIVSTIVDVAHVTAVHQLASGDAAAASRASTRGLLVEPCSEALHRDAIHAALRRGEDGEVARAVARMKDAFDSLDLGDDLMPETVELLRTVAATAHAPIGR